MVADGYYEALHRAVKSAPGIAAGEIIASPRRTHGLGTWLSVEWLASLRHARVLDPATWPLYGKLVDALAAENYAGAVELQRRDE